MNETERRRVAMLARGEAEPRDGFERHFVRVVLGDARPALPREREWLKYWHSISSDSAGNSAHGDVPAAVATASTRRRRSSRPAPSMVDMAVVAGNLGKDIVAIAQVQQDPMLVRAIEMTTETALEELASDPDTLQGAISTAKGKYFELLVQDHLNKGGAVGDLVLMDGQRAALAESMNQPGWDLAVLDSHSKVADVVQIKATDSVDYIRETLERYPDIKIISTTEAAKNIHGGLVIDSGITNADIERVVGHAIGAQAPSFLQDFVDTFSPLFPLVFIASTEGYKVVAGKKSVERALDQALVRASNSITGAAVGALFYAMGFGWTSIVPAVLAARAGPEGVIAAVEGAYDGVVGWLERRAAKTRHEFPKDCVRWAAFLNSDFCTKMGISRVFTPEYIAKHFDSSPTGLPIIDDIVIGHKLANVFYGHPVVKAQLARLREEEYEEARRQILKELGR